MSYGRPGPDLDLVDAAGKRLAELIPEDRIEEFLSICQEFRAHPATIFPEFVYRLRERFRRIQDSADPGTGETSG